MTRSRLVLMLLAAALAATAVVSARGRPSAGEALPPGSATVTKVVDGDTIHVRLGGRTEKVRLIGVDTPESVKPNSPVECFAREASAHTKQLVPAGTVVRLVRDVEARDRYGRLLAYVYRSSDGLFVNLALAQDGFAAPLTIPPNVAHAEVFAAASSRARQERRGLRDACGGPHEPAPSGDGATEASAKPTGRPTRPPDGEPTDAGGSGAARGDHAPTEGAVGAVGAQKGGTHGQSV